MTMLDLHRRTLTTSMAIVDAIQDTQWQGPTPCGRWNLRQLLTHMIRENRGFAAAAGGETVDKTSWTSHVSDDPRTDYPASAVQVVAAFAAGGALGGTAWLPQIRTGITIPTQQALTFHLLDYLVHGWDVAVAIGYPVEYADDLVDAVMDIAQAEVPDGPRRHHLEASFGPPVPIDPAAPTLDRLLAYLGRDPGWKP